MKHFLAKLKNANSKLFSEFVKAMRKMKFSANDDIVCEFVDGLFVLMYYGREVKPRKFVEKCKIKFLKKVLRFIFPDKVLFPVKSTMMEFELLVGFLEEFLSHFGYNIDVYYKANQKKYCYSVNWIENDISRTRSFDYVNATSYQIAKKGALIECFGMMQRHKIIKENAA